MKIAEIANGRQVREEMIGTRARETRNRAQANPVTTTKTNMIQ